MRTIIMLQERANSLASGGATDSAVDSGYGSVGAAVVAPASSSAGEAPAPVAMDVDDGAQPPPDNTPNDSQGPPPPPPPAGGGGGGGPPPPPDNDPPADGADVGDGLVTFAVVPPHLVPSAGVELSALQADGSFRLRLPDPQRSAAHRVPVFHGLDPPTSLGFDCQTVPRGMELCRWRFWDPRLRPQCCHIPRCVCPWGAPASRLSMRFVSC